ncbi:MAG: hypothetical protein E5X67_32215 [Mesorhizobium sp.]|uniref:hypothetical protein n=1 Tax=Mesorhizobium sp. TaxID=1871066 RepID=UPI001215DF84|nr:hypothetical protein [Mesorhizobium sp.]TIP23706.1 MAG: hypothetical protein E5X67_32215 [Mesorhizobium sp.]
MRGDKDGYLALGIAFGFMGALSVFVWVNGFASIGYCRPDENGGACLREWFGALSGWAAFIGAAVALPYLAAQAREAQKQTAFTVGDAEPEFVITRDRRARRATLTVTNWSRSLIMVDAVSATHDSRVAVYDISDADNPSVPSWQQQRAWGEQGAFRVYGWLDRASAPPQRRLKLLFSIDGKFSDDLNLIASRMEFIVSYRVVGQRHRRETAKVTTLEIADE